MATVYSGWSDTWRPSGSSVDKQYRARLDYSISQDATYVYCSATTYFNLNSTVTVESSYNSASMSATNGATYTGSFSTTFNGATTVVAVSTRSYSWPRTTSGYTVYVSGSVRSTKKSWDGYTMTATASIWVPARDSYAVTYNANTGTNAPATQTKWYDITLNLQPATANPSKVGYTFTGWNTAADGSGRNYAPGSAYTANAGMTLYAQWVPNTYTVAYNKNDINATGTMENSTFTYDTDGYLSLNTFKKKDYLFAGWGTTSDGLPQYSDGEEIRNLIPNGSITLYAIWEKQYTPPDIQNPVAYRTTTGGASDDTGTGFYTAIYVTPGIKETSLNVYNVNMPTRVSAYYKLTSASSWTQIDSDRTTPAMDSWVVTVPSTPYFNVLEGTIFTDYIYDIKFVADLIDKALSEDTTVNASKTYYTYDSVNNEYEEVTPTGTENPSALEWYEDEVKESVTAQTVLPAAKFLIDANPNSDSLALFTTADDLEYNSVILGSDGDVKIEYRTNESAGTLDYDIEQALAILEGRAGSLANVPITYVGGATLGALTATLTTSGWSNNSQTVTVSGVKSNSIVIATPSPASFDDYTINNVRCAGQSTDELTFTCDFIPDNEIVINIINITIA